MNQKSESNISDNLPWEDKSLNVVIPMAGDGSRFAMAGYTFPKPLIDVNGKPMIQRVVESLNIKANYIYIVKKEHFEKYALQSFLNLVTPNCKIVILDEKTDGAARTVLKTEDFIDNENPVLVANSDQIIKWNSSLSMYKFFNSNLDGLILTFEATHPKWSFVKVENDLVTQVSEKNPISNIATVGVYLWKHGYDLINSIKSMINKDIRTNNEYYLAPSINELIREGKKIGITNVQSMFGVGTPEDLNQFLLLNK